MHGIRAIGCVAGFVVGAVLGFQPNLAASQAAKDALVIDGAGNVTVDGDLTVKGAITPNGGFNTLPALAVGGASCTAAGSVKTVNCEIPGSWTFCALTYINPQYSPRSSGCSVGVAGGKWQISAYSGYKWNSSWSDPKIVCSASCLKLNLK